MVLAEPFGAFVDDVLMERVVAEGKGTVRDEVGKYEGCVGD